MKNIDIIVMGKTGSGKSTLINSVLEEELAPTGTGQAVTRKNEIFTKQMMLPVGDCKNGQYGLVNCKLNMYDTVGLEIDSAITNQTLKEIEKHIETRKAKMNSDSFHLVWFCVNNRSSRFEAYELDLINKLSVDYEIPFVIVLTQCFSNEEGALERQIRQNIPEVARKRVLAKDYSSRGGKISAYGITELLQLSIFKYKSLKVSILEKKLRALDIEWEAKLKRVESQGKNIVWNYTENAKKAGWIPGGCIPYVHVECGKMINEINELAGISFYADDAFVNFVVGAVMSVFMLIPFISRFAAEAYVEKTGEDYLECVIRVVKYSTSGELENNALMQKRIKAELQKLNEEN